MRTKKSKGAALVEAALVFLPFLALTLGGMEFMWHFHVRQCLTAAADAAVREVATYHGEVGPPDSGASPQSLDPLRPTAETAAKDLLTDMGFSNDFISSVTVDINYIDNLNQVNPRLDGVGGFPQKEKLRLVGSVVSVPWLKAMVFGNFAIKAFNVDMEQPSQLTVIAFQWKKWKVDN